MTTFFKNKFNALCNEIEEAEKLIETNQNKINEMVMACAKDYYLNKIVMDGSTCYKVTEIRKVLPAATYDIKEKHRLYNIDAYAEKYELIMYGNEQRYKRCPDTWHYFRISLDGEYDGTVLEDFDYSSVIHYNDLMKDQDGDVIRNSMKVSCIHYGKIVIGTVIDFDSNHDGMFMVDTGDDSYIMVYGKDLKIIK